MKTIKTSETTNIRPFLDKLFIPSEHSHKGQNGKLLVIGGSKLFHAASIWAAEIASHFVDMVHYASTEENNEVMKQLKILFRNGMVVTQTDIDHYAHEDDAVLIGPGMVRSEVEFKTHNLGLEEALSLEYEPEKTFELVRYLISTRRATSFIFDAGALQMMKADWLKELTEKPIVTPHQLEFKRLFGIDVSEMSVEEKARAVQSTARRYNTVVLLKAVVDFISDGDETIMVEGGNAGLTKGGTGDILAGLIAALRTKNDPMTSCVLASYLLKRTADVLFEHKGTWYNNSDLIGSIPDVIKLLT